MKILDATCGFKGIWYQKNHPFVTFMDNRNITLKSTHKNQKPRTYVIKPDIVSNWEDTPFPDNYFDMVVFDPPHLIRKRKTVESTMMKQYGYLYESDYKVKLKNGIRKLFDVLKNDGVFVFKWNDGDKSINEVLPLFPFKPLFGTQIGQRTNTYWIVFIKHRLEQELDINYKEV